MLTQDKGFMIWATHIGVHPSMSFWDFKRSSASVRLLVEFGQEQGLDIAKLLARSRL